MKKMERKSDIENVLIGLHDCGEQRHANATDDGQTNGGGGSRPRRSSQRGNPSELTWLESVAVFAYCYFTCR